MSLDRKLYPACSVETTSIAQAITNRGRASAVEAQAHHRTKARPNLGPRIHPCFDNSPRLKLKAAWQCPNNSVTVGESMVPLLQFSDDDASGLLMAIVEGLSMIYSADLVLCKLYCLNTVLRCWV
ncbi:uncharacterized protein K460DRAFT_363738 [Cucurbitaria berberidis CBS 394.84]|uniref:Uncharacterized protein n=1 Tax=Cucurbitaria berberidis CBS 394.84 TaxID=1168544 RepID=A0A9P4GL59_9PLEO|nr:uncharacterized protein K460DRAFT_363183 [Cucurbitaria berberidis CBS 394.84]XP_040790255.1 uncharacterized protein K460DRAFT_363738 [Cucurbitaria berberidis CBS 394.84]KAF1847075.1 hypothetical protein K460DRAFT_363183 [Cucurbitaria berberidis CBS 394.84]KAF1847692.1 hypothetical protein K460DRAFT_363738 [Cucurbitaria berberidis CBS 394.84]